MALHSKIDEWNGTIACTYHSPTSNDDDFVCELLKWCDDNIDDNDNFIACGDFNIDWMKDSTAKRRLREGMNDLGLIQIVNQPTRITNNSATLIDLCFTSDKRMLCKINSTVNLGDHECLSIQIKNIKNKNIKFKMIDSIKGYNSEDFNNEIKKANWDVANNFDILERADYFVKNLKNVMQKFVEKKKIPIGVECKWFNNELKKLKLEKTKNYNRAKISGNSLDWDMYKYSRNVYVSELKRAENDFYSQSVNGKRGDQKKMWKTLKEIMGRNGQSEINNVQFENECIIGWRALQGCRQIRAPNP